jgi:hypothetical protein
MTQHEFEALVRAKREAWKRLSNPARKPDELPKPAQSGDAVSQV